MMWIQTYTGKAWDLWNPQAANVRLQDILVPMNRIVRFNGHTSKPITLVQHSILVAELVGWRAKPYALLHDAHEAYIGDITTPVAEALGVKDGLADMKRQHDLAIFGAFGLPYWDDAIRTAVCNADMVALAIEKRDFMGDCEREWSFDLPDVPARGVNLCKADYALAAFGVALRHWCPKLPA